MILTFFKVNNNYLDICVIINHIIILIKRFDIFLDIYQWIPYELLFFLSMELR